MLEVGCVASEDLYIYIKGFECPMSSKQEMEICLEPESNLVPSAREPGLPGCQYFYQVDVGGRGDNGRSPPGVAFESPFALWKLTTIYLPVAGVYQYS